ncbi:MAG: hypothetical protein ABR519_06920 [Bacteroidales bacterium]
MGKRDLSIKVKHPLSIAKTPPELSVNSSHPKRKHLLNCLLIALTKAVNAFWKKDEVANMRMDESK